MNSCVIKDRYHPGFLTFMVVIFALAMYMVRNSIGAMAFVAVCGIFVVLIYVGSVNTITLTQESISCKNCFYKKTVPWSQIDTVSVAYLPMGKASGWYISLTWQTGKNRKGKPGFLFSYRDELKNAIVKYRGFLDRDDKANP